MIPQEYLSMSELDLRALCIWREAQGEGDLGKRGVGWTVQNRVENPGWWGHTAFGVILHPYQFSSFNANDPNHDKWPNDFDHSWLDCQLIAKDIMDDNDTDITNGATHYHDTSMGWPAGWGDQSEYIHTLDVGHFKFYKFVGKSKGE